MERPTVAIFGAGNVATHLAQAYDKVARVAQVYSRNIEHANTLANKLTDCHPIDSFADLIDNADLYVIAVSDDAIRNVAKQIPRTNGVVVHASGSTPMDVLHGVSDRYGVMYPLQTFSAKANVDVSAVPFFDEGCSDKALSEIDKYAELISQHIHHADSRQRQTLHIAAVFACNFTNHLLAISDQLLAADGYSLEVLRPLLDVTIDKAFAMPPAKAQTGPAIRGDKGVMQRHMDSLPPELAQIYKLLSDSISNLK